MLETLIRDNTEKLSLLTILTEELMKFRGIVKKHGKTGTKANFDWRKDLEILEDILRNQKEQKEFFSNDVRNLKLKIRSLPPISSRRKVGPSLNGIARGIEEKKKIEEDLPEKTSGDSALIQEQDSAFRNLLGRIIRQFLEISEAESIVEEFFIEILKKYSNIPANFFDNFVEICEKIEKRIEEVDRSVDFGGKIRGIVQEYANEVILQLEIESRGVGAGSVEISWNVKPKLDEFLDSLEIRRDVVTEVYVMKFLKMENGLELATDYVMTKLGRKPDSEMIVALREYASRTLRDIQREILGESETETTAQSSNSGV